MYTDISKEGTDEILERSMKNFRKNESDNTEASDVETDVRKHDVIEEVIIDEEEEVEEMELERLATRFSLFLDSFSIKRLETDYSFSKIKNLVRKCSSHFVIGI